MIGAALATLLADATTQDELYLACSSSADEYGEENEVSDALSALGDFLRGADAAVSRAAITQLVELLLDAAADKSRGARRHRRVGALFQWLLTHPDFAEHVAAALDESLCQTSAGASRLKLATATAMRVEVFAHGAAIAHARGWEPDVLVRLLRMLCRCNAAISPRAGSAAGGSAANGSDALKMDSAPAAAVPTVLDTALCDAAVLCFAQLCRNATSTSDWSPARPELQPVVSIAIHSAWREAFRRCVPFARELVLRLQRWRQSQLAFTAASDELMVALSAGSDEHAADVLMVAGCRLWVCCAPLLLCSAERMRKPHVNARFDQWLDRAEQWSTGKDVLRDVALGEASGVTAADVVASSSSSSATLASADGLPPHVREAFCGLALQIDSLDPPARSALLARTSSRLHRVSCAALCAGACADAALPLVLLRCVLPTLMQGDGESSYGKGSGKGSRGDGTGRQVDTGDGNGSVGYDAGAAGKVRATLSSDGDTTRGVLAQPTTAAIVLLQPLLDLLQATDDAPPRVQRLFAAFCLEHPSCLLPDVIAKLRAAVPSQRANAIGFLSSIADATGSLAANAGGGGTQQRFSSLIGTRASVEQLAATLVDGVLAAAGAAGAAGRPLHMEKAAALLAQLDLCVSLPILLRVPDSPPPAEGRSVEASAPAAAAGGGEEGGVGGLGVGVVEELMLLVLRAASPTDAVSVAIDALRDVNELPERQSSSPAPASPSIAHPGQIGLQAQPAVAAGSNGGGGGVAGDPPARTAATATIGEERLLRMLGSWSMSLPLPAWPSVLRVACAKFFAAPTDMSSLHVLKRLLSAGSARGAVPAASSTPSSTPAAPSPSPSSLPAFPPAPHCAPAADLAKEEGARVATMHEVVVGAAVQRLESIGGGYPAAAIEAATAGLDLGGGGGGGGDDDRGDSRRSVGGSKPSVAPTASPSAARGGTFDRLRPLLLLELLPEAGWLRLGSDRYRGGRLETLCARCRSALLGCFVDGDELQQVRKMACSLLARLPPEPTLSNEMLPRIAHLGTTASRLAAPTFSGEPEPTQPLALYYLCCAATLHPSAASMVAKNGEGGASDALFALLRAGRGGEALTRLQRGAMDCLSRTLCALSSGVGDDNHLGMEDAGGAAAAAGGGASWEGCGSPLALLRQLVERVLSLLVSAATESQAHAILSVATRMQHARGGGALTAPLAATILTGLLHSRCSNGRCPEATTMQCLFDIAFHAQPHLQQPILRQLQQTAHTGARSGQPSVRLASLKLLGVTLTSLATGRAAGDDDEQVARQLRDMLEMLHELATRDASDDVRSLAWQLAQTAFGGEGIA